MIIVERIRSNLLTESNLMLANKIMTIGRWVLEGAIAIYCMALINVILPQNHGVDNWLMRFSIRFLEHFPFDDIQLTWILTVFFGILIAIKVLLLKKTNFYKSRLKFIFDISTMIFWIVFCLGFLIVIEMGYLGEVLHWFRLLPYEFIPMINGMFS